MKALVAALLLAALPARAEWTATDTGLELAYAVSHLADWSQTRAIALRPERWHEMNPILGEHPSLRAVDAYFAATLVGHVAVSALLPKRLRHGWQVGTFALEVTMVTRNAAVFGLTVQLP